MIVGLLYLCIGAAPPDILVKLSGYFTLYRTQITSVSDDVISFSFFYNVLVAYVFHNS